MATDIRTYLMETYEVEADCVKNGAEADEDQAGLYTGEEDSWVVYGQMPNTNETGWFFAGYSTEIEADILATFG
jgi:hypothetical protein